jgi:hypothetical protein
MPDKSWLDFGIGVFRLPRPKFGLEHDEGYSSDVRGSRVWAVSYGPEGNCVKLTNSQGERGSKPRTLRAVKVRPFGSMKESRIKGNRRASCVLGL